MDSASFIEKEISESVKLESRKVENIATNSEESGECVVSESKVPDTECVITHEGCPAGYHRRGPFCVPMENDE